MKFKKIFLSLVLLLVSFNLLNINHMSAQAATSKSPVRPYELMAFSYLAYDDLTGYKGKTVNSFMCDKNFQKNSKFYKDFRKYYAYEGFKTTPSEINTAMCEELNMRIGGRDSGARWSLIMSIDDNKGVATDIFSHIGRDLAGVGSGFGVNVFERKIGNVSDIVIAYRGSDEAETDWAEENSKILISPFNGKTIEGLKSSKQRRFAELVAANALANRPNSNVYFTGHSLGGFLAQYVALEVQAGELHKRLAIPEVSPNFPIRKLSEWQTKINLMKKKLAARPGYKSQVVGLVTYNAPGIFSNKEAQQNYRAKYKLNYNFTMKNDLFSKNGLHFGNTYNAFFLGSYDALDNLLKNTKKEDLDELYDSLDFVPPTSALEAHALKWYLFNPNFKLK